MRIPIGLFKDIEWYLSINKQFIPVKCPFNL